MQLVEQHVIDKTHRCWKEVDDAAFASKNLFVAFDTNFRNGCQKQQDNLYNLANYHMRQNFFETGHALSLKELYSKVKGSDAYCGLPRKVSNWVLKTVEKSWTAYFAAHREWEKKKDKFLVRLTGLSELLSNGQTKFTAEPRIPKYKDKETGRYLLIYELGAISRKKELKEHRIIKPSGLSLQIQTKQSDYHQVRIIPRKTHYVVEVVYTKSETQAQLNSAFTLGVDIFVLF